MKTRKKGNVLEIIIDDNKYFAWFWTPSAIYKEKREELIKNNSWLIEVEGAKSSQTIEVKNCLNYSPYVKGYDYLKNNKKAREILINETLKIKK